MVLIYQLSIIRELYQDYINFSVIKFLETKYITILITLNELNEKNIIYDLPTPVTDLDQTHIEILPVLHINIIMYK